MRHWVVLVVLLIGFQCAFANPDTAFRLEDRLRLQQWFTTYAHLLDSKQFDRVPTLFTEHAVLNYTATAGVSGSPLEMSEWLSVAFSVYVGRTMHQITNFDISFTGDDSARVRAMLYNPVLVRGFGMAPFAEVGGWLEGSFVRHKDSKWRADVLDFDLAFNTANWNLCLIAILLLTAAAVTLRPCFRRGLSHPAALPQTPASHRKGD